ncbi:MAG: putative 2-desacetyl-2-hydroxyethyl bacteriochlorophyllide A dehydrogenase [Promethearchaeota archaeon]|nr:MAG: putative 2-desacetyl-2-hydroxyethyl bacteriochlorophyllide A dehydrogenase [Candidatus Lokiarchaeota archaeon]
MKAAVFEDIKKIVFHTEYPNPTIGPDDVLIQTKFCGICGSDLHNFKFKMYQTPLIMGHELSGVVKETGKNVKGFKPGHNVCGINVKLDISGGKLGGLGIFENGGFAEYVKAPEKYVFHVPTSISLKEAIMIESFANITRAMKLSQITDNEKILIIGGGNIGLCFLTTFLVNKSPEYVVVIEPQSFLRKKALEFGASDAFPPRKTKIKKYLKQQGSPTFIFDCVANQDTILLSIDVVERGGTLLLEGIHKGTIEFPAFLINSKEISIKGCLGHDREDILRAIELIKTNEINLSKFITNTVKLENLQQVFTSYLEEEDRDFIKNVVEIGD